jgi:hypothetical protein
VRDGGNVVARFEVGNHVLVAGPHLENYRGKSGIVREAVYNPGILESLDQYIVEFGPNDSAIFWGNELKPSAHRNEEVA